MNPVLALSWEIVGRVRWVVGLGAAYTLLACLVLALLPASLRHPALSIWIALPLVGVSCALVTAAHGEGADLVATRGGYPRRLLTLPVTSATLATVPFWLLAGLLALIWGVIVYGVLWPCGVNLPFLTPALVVATAMGWVQAMAWLPMPLPWVRLVGVLLGTLALLITPFILLELGTSRLLVNSGVAGCLAVAYLLALLGVRLSRQGVGVADAVALPRGLAGAAVPPRFASPWRAQLWLEWRHLGWVALVHSLVAVLIALPLVTLVAYALTRPYILPAIGGIAEALGPAWSALTLLLIVPLTQTFVVGDLGLQRSHVHKHYLSTYAATLPYSSAGMIRAKVLISGAFLVVEWLALVAVCFLWGLATGNLDDMLQRLAAAGGVGLLFGGVLLAAVVQWLAILGGVWIRVCGRQWVHYVVLGVFFALTVGLVLVVQLPAVRAFLVASVPVLLALGLAAKIGGVAWVSRALVAGRHATWPEVAAVVVGWGVLVGALAALAAWQLPIDWRGIAGVVVLTPLVQTLAAPLALAWNRHR